MVHDSFSNKHKSIVIILVINFVSRVVSQIYTILLIMNSLIDEHIQYDLVVGRDNGIKKEFW